MRHKCMAVMLMTLLVSPMSLADAPPPDQARTRQELYERLCKLEQVDASAIGFAGVPGKFYTLSLDYIRHGDAKTFLALLEDHRSIVRAMGLVCLTRTDRKIALGQLTKRLGSEYSFTCFPGGCVGYLMTEGQFCWELLHDADYLIFSFDDRDAWLSPFALLEIDLRVLSMDACRDFHYLAASTATSELEQTAKSMSLINLKGELPTLSMLEFVRGLGRAEANERSRRLLVQAVRDATLQRHVRLAAASGLTRDLSKEAGVFFTENRGLLDRLASELAAGFFTNRREERILHEKALEDYRTSLHEDLDEDDWEAEAWEKRLMRAYAKACLNDSPVAIDELIDAASTTYIEDYPEFAETFVATLARASARAVEAAHCWDTDSEKILNLQDLLTIPSPIDERRLGTKDRSKLLKKVKSAKKMLHDDCATSAGR